MEIKCPVCSIPIEVTADHIGQKGRCPSCESKFIIPKNSGDEVQILHRGEVTDDAPKRKVSLVTSPKAQPRGQRVPARLNLRQKRSPLGLYVLIVCVAALIGFTLSRNQDGDLQADQPSSGSEVGSPPPLSSPAALPEDPAPGQGEPVLEPEMATIEQPIEPSSTPEPEVVAEVTAPVEEVPPALTEEQKMNALVFLKSDEQGKRKAAYAGFRKLGSREKSTYLEMLALAREHHADALGGRAWDLATGDRDLSNFQEAHDSWIVARDAAKQMAQTNWKDEDAGNYQKKHAEMDDAAADAIKFFDRVVRSAKRAAEFDPSGLQRYADALAEIRDEIAWCHDRAPEGALPLLEEISQAGGASDYVALANLVAGANQVGAALDAAEQYNAGCAWAGGAYKTFATTLNGRRAAFGLGALRLDEQLSKACGDHSADMAANNYFSHTGLTPETRGFGDRARRASFSGFATGECIFMGNASADAAHRAWWYSDGHRLIMYANNPNTLGLGLYGKHWTLNTGKK